jgi:DNA-binding response OmpR family regulator
LDGFEVLKQVRSQPALSCIPIFILSAPASDVDIYHSNSWGISKYIVKPLATEDIAPEISHLLSSRTEG